MATSTRVELSNWFPKSLRRKTAVGAMQPARMFTMIRNANPEATLLKRKLKA